MKSTTISLANNTTAVELLPGRAALLPEFNTIVVADVHIGKAATFRQAGLPVPDTTGIADISRLDELVQQHSAHLVVVGDLVHSTQNSAWNHFADVRKTWKNEVTVILGNHDKHVQAFATKNDIDCKHTHQLGGLTFCHDPNDVEVLSPSGKASQNEIRSFICAHIHPAIRLPLPVGGSVRLPCFWLRGNTLTLPAFATFAGAHTIEPQETDMVYVELDAEIVAVEAAWLAQSRG